MDMKKSLVKKNTPEQKVSRKSPSISLVTVCYNSESTIADTIRSVLNQSHRPLEYVLIDGKSKDSTLQVIKKELKKTPKGIKTKVISEKDSGIYDAMSKGIRLATGDVIAILNADDCLAYNDALKDIGAHFNRETECILSDVIMCDENDWSKIIRYYRANQFKPNQLLRGIMPPHAGFYAKRKLFEKYGSYKSDYRLAGDFELMVRFFLNQGIQFEYLPKTVVKMRVGGTSNVSLKNRIRLNQESLKALKENGHPSSWIRILSKVPGKLLQYVVRPK